MNNAFFDSKRDPSLLARTCPIVILAWNLLIVGSMPLLAQDRGVRPTAVRYSLALHGGAGSSLIKYREMRVQQAVRHVLRHSLRPGDGGVITVSRNGQIAMEFTTDDRARAAADSAGRFEIRWGDASP